ncbi:hypothetical protein MTO96_040624 [Rhipicephalus appendiculatus]
MVEASSSCNRAPVYSPASALGTCNVEYPELRWQVNQLVLLTNRKDLYMIFVALVVSDTGCTRALTFYFADDTMPERKAEETRQYISASFCVARVLCPQERRRLQRASFGNQRLQYWRQPLLNREHQGSFICWERDQVGLRNAARSLRKKHPRVFGWLKRRVPGCGQDGGVRLGDGRS